MSNNFDKVLANSKLKNINEESYVEELKECVLFKLIPILEEKNLIKIDDDDYIAIFKGKEEYDEVAIIETPRFLTIIDYVHKGANIGEGRLYVKNIDIQQAEFNAEFSVHENYLSELQAFAYKTKNEEYKFLRKNALNDENYMEYYENKFK